MKAIVITFAGAAAMSLAALPASAQQDAAQLAATKEKAQVCAECHGPNGNSANPQYPILAGQSWRYLYIELKDFKEGRRSGRRRRRRAAFCFRGSGDWDR